MDLYYKRTEFPVQKLPLVKKDEAWRKACTDVLISREGSTYVSGRSRRDTLRVNYDLYNGIFNEDDFRYVINPFNVEDGFPAHPQNMNIIKPKIDLLIGEETKRPFNFKVFSTNDESVSQVQDFKKKSLINEYLQSIVDDMSNEDEVDQRLQEIDTYVKSKYSTAAEQAAYNSLLYLRQQLSIDHEFVKGWKDGLISGEEIYYVGIVNGEPMCERVNPYQFTYDNDPDVEYIEDGDWAIRRFLMSPGAIYDRFQQQMTEEELDKLLSMVGGDNLHRRPGDVNYNSIIYRDKIISDINNDEFFKGQLLPVWHVTWKSFKKIGYLHTTDPETGEQIEDIVDETYKLSEEEKMSGVSIEWDWMTEVWEGHRIGTDIYLDIRPVQYQYQSLENPKTSKLPYVGARYNATNTRNRSLVDTMKPLQYMYIVIWYRLELALARDKGKVLTMDITQIPKSMGLDVKQWMHYLSALGVNLVNPYEEGWCFAPGTKVLMFDGSIKNIEDVQLGDLVMGPDGTSRKVLELHSGTDHMYKIKPFVGSDEQIVNSKHKVYHKYRETWTNKIHNKVSSVKELYDEFIAKPKKKEHCYLERVANIDSWNSTLKLDPYFLGLWLGDGFSDDIAIENVDTEVLEYLQNFAITNNLYFSIHPNDKSKSVTIRLANINNPVKGGKMLSNPIKDILVELGIYGHGNKDIPSNYIYSSKENRLQLLAGLIDTDGSFCKNGNYYEFTQCADRKHIVDKFLFIARSLGFKCKYTIKPGQTIKIHKNTNITVSQPTYSVRIYHGDFEIPCKIDRKKHSWKKRRVFNEKLTTFDIEYNGIGEYYGFSTDGDHLFLLSDYTIVHNSIPGREGGKPSSFGQIGQVDLSMSKIIGDYIGLLDKVEDMIGELSGVSRQREGQIQTSELVGNVQRATVQSSHITEPLFEIHNHIKKRVYTAMLNCAKFAWSESNRKKLHFIVDDFVRKFIDIDDNFLYSDFDVFVSDSTKESQNLEAVKSLMQPAMQNGATLSDAIEILTTESISEIKRKMKDIETRREQQMQKQQESEQQMMQQQQQMQAQLQADDNRIKEEDSIRKAETAIEVARINAESKNAMSESFEGNPEVNETELFRLQLDRDKIKAEDRFKQASIAETIRSNKALEEIKRKELVIKRKQASRPASTSKK